jgi:isoamylase
VALARGRDDGYNPDHPFLVALRTDPVLSRVKLIAEPWDMGVHGWRTGQFPPPFAEWNDRFRDAVRTFWLTDVERSARKEPGHGVRDLATRLAGSQDLFGAHDRGPIASVNYLAAHDGFTLADTTTYSHKHNGANGEDNRDGSDDNRSWNHGLEGPGGPETDASLLAARRRSMRNLLATELLATGVPMINAGDELGRTQRGNNNAYCQDNEVSWLDWELEPWQGDLLATTRFLARFRATSPVLGQRLFFSGRAVHQDGLADVQWFGADGQPMHHGAWDDPHNRTLTMILDGTHVGGESLLIAFHGGAHDAEVTLPKRGAGTEDTAYRLVWDSAWELPPESSNIADIKGRADGADAESAEKAGPVSVTAASIRVYSLVP